MAYTHTWDTLPDAIDAAKRSQKVSRSMGFEPRAVGIYLTARPIKSTNRRAFKHGNATMPGRMATVLVDGTVRYGS